MKKLHEYLVRRYRAETNPPVELTDEMLAKLAADFTLIHPHRPCAQSSFERFLAYILNRHRHRNDGCLVPGERIAEHMAAVHEYDDDLLEILASTTWDEFRAVAGQDFQLTQHQFEAVARVAVRIDPRYQRPLLRTSSNSRIADVALDDCPDTSRHTLRTKVCRFRAAIARVARERDIPDPELVGAQAYRAGPLEIAIEQVDGLIPWALLLPHHVIPVLDHLFRVLTWSGLPPRTSAGEVNRAWMTHVGARVEAFERRCDVLRIRDDRMSRIVRDHLVAAFRLYCATSLHSSEHREYEQWMEQLFFHVGSAHFYLDSLEL